MVYRPAKQNHDTLSEKQIKAKCPACMTKVAEHLLSNLKVLNSNFSTIKKVTILYKNIMNINYSI
jgi:hypothetical protein